MYEEQGRKQNVEATAQLEPASAGPLQSAPPPDLDLIFREHHSTVFRAAYRVTGNASDAEDVLQTVFMRLLRRQPDAEAVGNMEGYLRRAAVNAALDLIRSRQAAPQVPLEDVAPLLPENASACSRSPATGPPKSATGCDRPSPGSVPGPPKCSPCASLKAATIRKSPKPSALRQPAWRSRCPARAIVSNRNSVPTWEKSDDATRSEARSAPRTSHRRNPRRTHRPSRNRSRRQPGPGAPRATCHAAHVAPIFKP